MKQRRRLRLTKLGRKVLAWLLLAVLVALTVPVLRFNPCYAYNISYFCVILPAISLGVVALSDF